ncbi:MAG: undecaprenyl-diphosphatase UppP [Thermomicrobiales bacterium]
MTLIEAIVLGIVQGLTEFLPVSSSAHLIIVPWLLGWESPGLAFDAALHLGTLGAVIIYFWRDILAMIVSLPRALRHPGDVLRSRNPRDTMPRLALLIAIGTIPGAVIGYWGQDWIDEAYHQGGNVPDRIIVAIAMALAGLALFMLVGEKLARHTRTLSDMRLPDGIAIGFSQAAALIPGVSRSGATITTGLFRDLTREDAARFSFLLGIPIIAVAGLKGLYDTFSAGLPQDQAVIFIVGIITSLLAGLFAISALLRYVQRSTFRVFIVYRLVLAVVLVLLTLVK